MDSLEPSCKNSWLMKNAPAAMPERLRKATVIAVDVDELDITDREATVTYIRRISRMPSSTALLLPTWMFAEIAAMPLTASTPLMRNLALACKINAMWLRPPDPYFYRLCILRYSQRRCGVG